MNPGRRATDGQPTPDPAASTGYSIPKTVVWSVVLLLPAMIASGASYVATQANEAKHISESFEAFKRDVYEHRTNYENNTKALAAQTDTNARAVAQMNDTTQRNLAEVYNTLRDRVTRLEAQAAYLARSK